MHMKKEVYAQRRKNLIERIAQTQDKPGVILLFGAFEQHRTTFRQESSFYYFTGVEEPGSVVAIALDGTAKLFIPHTSVDRSIWMQGVLATDAKQAQAHGFEEILYLGAVQTGFDMSPLAPADAYATLLSYLSDKEAIFTCAPANVHKYVEQKQLLHKLQRFDAAAFAHIVDISADVAALRRKKSLEEIEALYKAIDITLLAQESAATAIGDAATEAQVHATIQYVFMDNNAREAFPSIVGSGKQSTVLHYCRNNQTMRSGDLVVVDIGADYNYYCADITRTYPVSGTFSKRQKEIYTAVLETQEYIASLAKPGMWINNKEKPEQSLQHLAVSFLEKKGFAKYFPHSIGHFLGMDVHDVGNAAEPLQEGDVITIEPGIYIPEERIGVRIEDNYWVIKNGAECLSAGLPKEVDEIENLAQSTLQDPLDQVEEEEEDFIDDENFEIQ